MLPCSRSLSAFDPDDPGVDQTGPPSRSVVDARRPGPRAYIGITGGARPLPPRAAAKIERAVGVEIVEVVAGSRAARSGPRSGDIILEVDAHPRNIAQRSRIQASLSSGLP